MSCYGCGSSFGAFKKEVTLYFEECYGYEHQKSYFIRHSILLMSHNFEVLLLMMILLHDQYRDHRFFHALTLMGPEEAV